MLSEVSLGAVINRVQLNTAEIKRKRVNLDDKLEEEKKVGASGVRNSGYLKFDLVENEVAGAPLN